MLPDNIEIAAIEMEQYNGQLGMGLVRLDNPYLINRVISCLDLSTNTLKRPLNDFSESDNYLVIRVITKNERRIFVLYTNSKVYYLEEPYKRVYLITRNESVNLYGIYTGNIDAKYRFKECIYMHPVSSYFPFSGTGELYAIDKEKFEIIDEKSGEVIESFEIDGFETELLNENKWNEFFDIKVGIPNISSTDYPIRMIALSDRYRIFYVDTQTWLVKMNGENIYSIYSIISDE